MISEPREKDKTNRIGSLVKDAFRRPLKGFLDPKNQRFVNPLIKRGSEIMILVSVPESLRGRQPLNEKQDKTVSLLVVQLSEITFIGKQVFLVVYATTDRELKA
ncbi:hypothetical protein GCM10023261_11010 [Bartonella jaculi]|uniref:Uncharacterized protein n=2 Tax=Bartonella jaculi TaxID=686226 RepID=A0ABP9N3F6_9HYPH